MKQKIFLLIFTMMLFAHLFAQQTNYKIEKDDFSTLQISFTVGDIDLQQIVKNEITYTTLNIQGYIPSTEIGVPTLPLFSSLIEVPLCNSFDVRVSEVVYDTIDISGHILLPAQEERSKSDTTSHPFAIDDKIYNTNAYYSLPQASIENVGIARDRRLARIQFSPIAYNPIESKIIVCRKATVSIVYNEPNLPATLEMFKQYHSPAFAAGTMTINHIYPNTLEQEMPIRYLIIAHSSFQGHLDSFIEWKKRKGFLTDVVYTGDANIGTTNTSIADYISRQYTNATTTNPAPTYVLIVGDHEQVPAFSTQISDGSYNHITDLYYVNWTDGDNIPDAYCGRFSAQTLAQLTPQIEKTLMYEQYTFSDPSFLDRAVMVAGVDGGTANDYGYTHADPAMDYAITHYINGSRDFSQVMYFKNNTANIPSATNVTIGSNNSSNSATVRSYYNQGAGFINYSAHGSATSWGTPNFTVSHVGSMTNNQKFGLMIGNCCLTNKFETTTCFGEALLRKGNYCGAVGYIGGSNSTYWTHDFYWAIGVRSSINATMSMAYDASNLGTYDHFCHTHNESYQQWATTQGAIMFAGNMAVQGSTADNTSKWYYWEIYHLMGDPSVMPYLTQASTMTMDLPDSLPYGTSSFNVSVAPYSYVAMTTADSHALISTTWADSNGVATLHSTTPFSIGDYEIVASAQQYVTTFADISIFRQEEPFVIVSLSDDTVTAGTSSNLPITVTNTGNTNATNIIISLSSDNSSVSFSSDTIHLSFLAADSSITFTDSIDITLANNLQNASVIRLEAEVHWDNNTTSTTTSCNVIAASPVIRMIPADLFPNINPGETANFSFDLLNEGLADLSPTDLAISSPTSLLSLSSTSPTATISIGIDSTFTCNLIISADSSLPENILVPITIQLGLSTWQLPLTIGERFRETFENGMSHLSGLTQGTYPWVIDSNEVYEGNYSIRSIATLTHSQTAEISFNHIATTADTMSFYYKVSSETNWDKFHFYIDDEEMMVESGDLPWTRAAFAVDAGMHTYKFTYAKDGSVNRYSDCAWIDDIRLPFGEHPAIFENLDICEGSNYTIHNYTINTEQLGEGSFIANEDNDTVFLVDYTVFPNYLEEFEIIGCDSITYNGETYYTNVVLEDVYTTVNGCDSVVVSTLIVNSSFHETISVDTVADSYIWNDVEYNASGIYEQSFTNSKGCDSILSLVLNLIDTTALRLEGCNLNQVQISVYPSPTSGILYINQKVLEVKVYDACGRLQRYYKDTDTFDIGDLPSGTYILNISTQKGSSIHKVVRI